MTGRNVGTDSIEPRKIQSARTPYDLLLSTNRYFQESHGFEILTPDAKLFCVLGLKNSLSVKEAMLFSGLSYRGFYLVVGRLSERGWIVFEADPRDARVRRIRLANAAQSLMAMVPESTPAKQVAQAQSTKSLI